MRDGDEWVINGEKWFTSAGRVADILFVMCTNGMFVVPRETPGVEIQPEPRNHNHIIYNDVRVPLDHLLGPEDGAKVLAQRRLGGGRIHHAMRTIAQCKLAFDMMCERALSRESHGKIIAEHQMVQEKIADSYAEIRMLRLFVLETAWKIDNTSTQETRTDIAAVKYTMAKVLREVSFNALHILGSLGTTNLTPLQAMYAGAPTMGIADGVDEVHKATVARNVLKGYRPHEGYWPTEYYPGEAREGAGEVRAAVRGRPRAARARRRLREVHREPRLNVDVIRCRGVASATAEKASWTGRRTCSNNSRSTGSIKRDPRLDGLTDDEYFWEPAPGAWNIRPRETSRTSMAAGAGDLVIDFEFPEPDPPPITTIAWRLGHVIVGIFGSRERVPLRRSADRLPNRRVAGDRRWRAHDARQRVRGVGEGCCRPRQPHARHSGW